ncbi:MAG: acetylornithine deacetylase [Gammaproteobacteria bacterium]|nr:acetylornithine deacetylase [Gammaproteobacteria bacterium]
MNADLEKTLQHLSALVACDTQNPPRQIGPDGLFAYLGDHLTGFELDLQDFGDGCINLLATRGQPDVLFNFHIDTVPASGNWSGDPFRLRLNDSRATGLGACDIKGAAACMLTAAAATDGAVALLFSSDEEHGRSRCVSEFLSTDHGFANVVVAEPTGARAVLAHRGIASAEITFTGIAGHASNSRAQDDSAIHRAMRWGNRALEFASSAGDSEWENLQGLRFNIGRIEGGVKPNVIAAEAVVRFGMRPLPGSDIDALLQQLFQLAEPHELEGYQVLFRQPSLPADSGASLAPGRELAQRLGLEPGDAVDFWTEAALFSASGLNTLVYGPGDIAQAHSADEWVALEQLNQVIASYKRLLS